LSGLLLQIDPNRLHVREINHQAVIAHGEARNPMATTPDRNHQILISRKPHASDDIGCTCTTCNYRRAAVDHGIKNSTGLVVVRIIASDDTSTHRHS
jgi:hypothetical protein